AFFTAILNRKANILLYHLLFSVTLQKKLNARDTFTT
ncbi:MAG: hypothetical protein ACJAXS_002931, partial [Colwellia sp.]